MSRVATMSQSLVSVGYYLGHPAVGPDPQRRPELAELLADLAASGRFATPLFADLDGARNAARLCAGAHAPQGLWIAAKAALKLGREVRDTPLGRWLARSQPTLPPPAVASGHDVIGFGTDLMLAFVREDAGIELCRELGLPTDPPPFLPDAPTARRLAAALDGDDLGAPVLWLPCWRTVHTTLD